MKQPSKDLRNGGELLKMVGLMNFQDFNGFHYFKSTFPWLVDLVCLINLFFMCSLLYWD